MQKMVDLMHESTISGVDASLIEHVPLKDNRNWLPDNTYLLLADSELDAEQRCTDAGKSRERNTMAG